MCSVSFVLRDNSSSIAQGPVGDEGAPDTDRKRGLRTLFRDFLSLQDCPISQSEGSRRGPGVKGHATQTKHNRGLQ